MTVLNQDLLIAQAYIHAAKTGEVRIPCGTSGEAYQMRFRFYGFIKRAKKGSPTRLSAVQLNEMLDAASRLQLVIEGNTLVMQDRTTIPGIAALQQMFGGAAEEAVSTQDKAVEEMGKRLLNELGSLGPSSPSPYAKLIKGE